MNKSGLFQNGVITIVVPIIFAVDFEIIHVASFGQVHRILSFPLDGVFDINEVSSVFYYKVSFEKYLRRKDAATLETKSRQF